MKNKLVLTIAVLFLMASCSEKQELLILDSDYLTVADLLEYCQSPCDQILNWEKKQRW